MPVKRAGRTGGGSSLMWALVPVLLLVAVGGTGATLWATGFFGPAVVVESHEGQLAFPALARPVKAYEKITREDLIDPRTGKLRVMWLTPEQGATVLRDLGKILGRVAARDKQPGYVLTENDLFPVGTRGGITAGVPPGKRSLSVPVEKVPGLELLRHGDRFDLLAALPARAASLSNIEQAALLGGVKPPDTRSGQLAKQTGIKPLVVGGTMVALTQGQKQSTGGAQTLTAPTGRAQSRSQAIIATVAVDPEEVAPLTEALGLDVALYCVARSGHAADESGGDAAIPLDGLVPVVATARRVPAFSRLEPDDLADTVTGRLNVFYFPPDAVRPEWITEFAALRGRVVSHAVENGSVLTDDDLLPPGTRPGLIAGAPAGTVVLPVEKERISGLDRLQPEDQFDVYARLPGSLRPTFPQTDWAALQGAVKPAEHQALEEQLRSGVRKVAGEAVYLGAFDGANDGQDAGMVGVAVPAEEATRFSQYLQDNYALFVAAASGRGVTPIDERRPDNPRFDARLPGEPRPRGADALGIDPAALGRSPSAGSSPTTELRDAGGGEGGGEEVGRDGISRDEVRRDGGAVRARTVAFRQEETDPVLPGRPEPIVEAADDGAADAGELAGYVSVPVTARPIEAYSRLVVEDFVDPATGQPRTLLFPRNRVQPGWALDLGELIDRVIARDVAVGRPLDDRDLLPIGSQAGPTAGIPIGMRALTVNGRQVLGLDGMERLQRGDRFQLLLVRPYDLNSFGATPRRGLSGGDAFAQSLGGGGLFARAAVDILCEQATLIDFGAAEEVVQTEVVNQTDTQTQTQLTPAGPVRTESSRVTPQVTERTVSTKTYLFAVPPDRVDPLAEALAVGAEIRAIPLPGAATPAFAEPGSGEADRSPSDERSPGATALAAEPESLAEFRPHMRPRLIEHIRGTQVSREVWITPGRPGAAN